MKDPWICVYRGQSLNVPSSIQFNNNFIWPQSSCIVMHITAIHVRTCTGCMFALHTVINKQCLFNLTRWYLLYYLC